MEARVLPLRRARSVTLVLALGAAGCTVVTALSDLDSSYGTSSGSVDAGDRDGGADAEAGGDASVDAYVSPCLGDAHALCDDFETHSLDETSIWTRKNVTSGMKLELATDVAYSGKRALSAIMTSSARVLVPSQALLERDFAGPMTAIDCRFRMRIQDSDLSSLASVMTMTFFSAFDSGIQSVEIGFFIGRNTGIAVATLAANEDDSHKEQYPLDAGDTQKWVDARLRVEPSDQGAVALSLDGTQVFSAGIESPIVAAATLRVGIVNGSPGNPTWRLLVDDVVCDLE